MATKKPTAAQLAARKLFAARVKAGEFSKTAKRKKNPLSRVKVNSPPQRPAGNDDAPSARLKSRRRKTAKIPAKGYYANPRNRVKEPFFTVWLRDPAQPDYGWEKVAVFWSSERVKTYAKALHASQPSRQVKVTADE